MRRALFIILLFLLLPSKGMDFFNEDTLVYLFPGQGADDRLFKHLERPPGYDTVNISYPVPEKKESLAEFALRFVEQIDRSRPYILLGVSLGGRICTELRDTLDPPETIMISSVKSAHELPGRYTLLKSFHLNRIIPKGMTKTGARVLQGIVEPGRAIRIYLTGMC